MQSTRKMVVVLALLSMQMMTFMMSSSNVVNASWASTSISTLHDEETYEKVLDANGERILYGSENQFTLYNVDTGILHHHFWFGRIAYRGFEVHTGTELTMSRFGSLFPGVFHCTSDGIITSAVTPSGRFEDSIIRVRHNVTDGYYRLQITEESPPVFVQFRPVSQDGALRCFRGVEGSRLVFLSENFSSATAATAEYSSRPSVLNVAGQAAGHSTMQTPRHILRTQVSSSI